MSKHRNINMNFQINTIATTTQPTSYHTSSYLYYIFARYSLHLVLGYPLWRSLAAIFHFKSLISSTAMYSSSSRDCCILKSYSVGAAFATSSSSESPEL